MASRLLIAAFVMLIGAATGFAAKAAPRCAYRTGSAIIDLPGHPFGAEATADGCWLFAALGGTRPGDFTGVAVLRNVDGRFQLIRTAALPPQVGGLSLSRDGKILVVADFNAVAVFDVGRLESGEGAPLLGSLPEGKGAGAVYVAITPDDHLLFVSDESMARLSVWDLSRARSGLWGASTLVGHIPQGAAPVGLAVSPDGKRLYSTSQVARPEAGFPIRCLLGAAGDTRMFPEGALTIIDVDRAGVDPAHAVLKTVAAGCSPVRIKLDSVHGHAWITARGEDALLDVDLEAIERSKPGVRRISAGSAPVGVAVRPDGGQALGRQFQPVCWAGRQSLGCRSARPEAPVGAIGPISS